MNFEEIQSIWNSQQPLDGRIDQEHLRAWIQSRHRTFSRIVGITEVVTIAMLLFVAAMFMRDPVLQGHDRILILGGIACLIAAVFVWRGRAARRKREIRYDDTLAGLVDQSIDAIDYQISRMRSFLWWFGGPLSLGLIIGLFIVDDSKRYLFYTVFIPAFVACMGIAYWQTRREIRNKLLPEKERLAALRRDLADE